MENIKITRFVVISPSFVMDTFYTPTYLLSLKVRKKYPPHYLLQRWLSNGPIAEGIIAVKIKSYFEEACRFGSETWFKGY